MRILKCSTHFALHHRVDKMRLPLWNFGKLLNSRNEYGEHTLYFGLVVLAACALAFDLERFQQNTNRRGAEVLGDAVDEILQTYYVPQAKCVNIFTMTDNKYAAEDVISYILKKLSGSLPYQLHMISKGALKNNLLKNVGAFNLFFVDCYESFRLNDDAITRRTLNICWRKFQKSIAGTFGKRNLAHLGMKIISWSCLLMDRFGVKLNMMLSEFSPISGKTASPMHT